MTLTLGVMVLSTNHCSKDEVSSKREMSYVKHNCCCNAKSLWMEAGRKVILQAMSL